MRPQITSRAAGARVAAGAEWRSRSRQRSMVQTKARALKRAAEAAAKPPSKKKAKAVSEPPVKKKRKGKQARDKAKEAATVSAAYLAPKAAAKGAVAPSEPTPTLRMRGLPFSATTDDISGMRPSDRTPDSQGRSTTHGRALPRTQASSTGCRPAAVTASSSASEMVAPQARRG